jgi:diadenosine tetraphosphate (Ap4A) HIT family hydrolase
MCPLRDSSVSSGCVFCTRVDQPPILFETPSLYVMPDRFPLVPGHVLIIPKRHYRCYGSAPAPVVMELERATARVKQFLESSYGAPVVINETGKTGQTVHHAHLHLSPHPRLQSFPPRRFVDHPDVTRVGGWDNVRERFTQHGQYYYVEVDGQRFIVESYHSPAIAMLRDVVAAAADTEMTGDILPRAVSPTDVETLRARFQEWATEPDSPNLF